MLDKASRVEALVEDVAKALGFGADVVGTAATAAGLARADLATSMVMELTALAGTMGRHYAKKEGLPTDVAKPSSRRACLEVLATSSPPHRPGSPSR